VPNVVARSGALQLAGETVGHGLCHCGHGRRYHTLGCLLCVRPSVSRRLVDARDNTVIKRFAGDLIVGVVEVREDLIDISRRRLVHSAADAVAKQIATSLLCCHDRIISIRQVNSTYHFLDSTI
jgi:hypothetical protein